MTKNTGITATPEALTIGPLTIRKSRYGFHFAEVDGKTIADDSDGNALEDLWKALNPAANTPITRVDGTDTALSEHNLGKLTTFQWPNLKAE